MLSVLHHPGTEFGRQRSKLMKRTLGATGMALAAGLASSLAATSPPVQIAREGTNVVLTFRGDLQHSAQVQGPYTNVTDVASPLRVPWTLASAGFWRARQDAGATLSQYLSAGMDHTVALRKDGSLWAWGLNYDGNLDDGTHTETNSPQRIATNRTWIAVAAGLDYTVALQPNHTLWAWGNNGGGRLGIGTWYSTNAAQAVATNETWRTVSAGGTHTVAVHADGTLWAWGNNYVGQLGDGTYTTVNSPQQVVTNADWHTVSAGSHHTVALRSDGTLWTWGANFSGELGNGTFTYTNVPQAIGTSATWRAVAAGGVLDGHSLAIRSDGTLWAWGDNFWGQLGDGHMFTKTNTPQQIGTNTNWQAIAAGGTHSVALQADGSLWTWGLNEDGQLGNGTDGPFTNVTTPQRIGTATDWVAITAGGNHTVALKSDGTLWAWGDNGWGQLGIATFDDANTPQPVLGGAVWGPPSE
jgi:alpha-tubulin suppressor-like RCC1 family protein